jgi:hypothetical protein
VNLIRGTTLIHILREIRLTYDLRHDPVVKKLLFFIASSDFLKNVLETGHVTEGFPNTAFLVVAPRTM